MTCICRILSFFYYYVFIVEFLKYASFKCFTLKYASFKCYTLKYASFKCHTLKYAFFKCCTLKFASCKCYTFHEPWATTLQIVVWSHLDVCFEVPSYRIAQGDVCDEKQHTWRQINGSSFSSSQHGSNAAVLMAKESSRRVQHNSDM